MTKIILIPLLLASLSAVGNALFAFGQKRSEVSENPFIFLIFTLCVCLFLFSVTAALMPKVSLQDYLSRNIRWIAVSGMGFYMTFTGFYFLYTRFGASYYLLYAVLSILTTSIVVGVLYFKESFNIYHGLAVVAAIATVVLFSLGQKMS